jgi:hypothetical protein
VGRRTEYILHTGQGFRHRSQDGLLIGPFLEMLAVSGGLDGVSRRPTTEPPAAPRLKARNVEANRRRRPDAGVDAVAPVCAPPPGRPGQLCDDTVSAFRDAVAQFERGFELGEGALLDR